jgi:pimeloyl-ACP methyl ester carboxylesterase
VGRLIAGGAFNDRPKQYNALEEALPLDRSAVNGIRCMRTMQGGPASEELRKPASIRTFDYAALEPVNDAGYSVLAQQLDYRSVPFTPHVEEGNSSNPAWTRHRIELPTGYDTGTFAIQLFLPTDHAPPYQVVFYMPDGGVTFAPVTTDGFDPSWGSIPLDFLLKSGRALAVVAFDGTFERQWSGERIQSMTYDEQFRTWVRHLRQELGRTIDHFATRKDLDAGKLGWFGVSMGAADMVPLLAVEKRIGAAVLYSGGIGLWDVLPMSEQPFNYYPRVTQPVLMLNGRWDILFPLPSQQRMLELLGTPEDSKKHVLFEAGHGNMPRFQVERATLDWFDQYLGQPAKQ